MQPLSVFSHVAAPAPRYMMRLALIEDLLRTLPQVNRFLEIGPGMGDLGLHLAARYQAAQGDLMDISMESAATLRQRLAQQARLHFEVGDFRKLRACGQYDLVVACEVFEHVEDDDSAFAAVHALLCSGGHFLFSAPAFRSHWQAADDYAGHHRRYEHAEVVEKFQRHGFDITQHWCYGFPLTTILNPLTRHYYAHKLRAKPLNRDSATHRSGVHRPFVRRLPVWLVSTLLWPMFQIQHLTRHKNIGDGYLVLARRR